MSKKVLENHKPILYSSRKAFYKDTIVEEYHDLYDVMLFQFAFSIYETEFAVNLERNRKFRELDEDPANWVLFSVTSNINNLDNWGYINKDSDLRNLSKRSNS